MQAPSLVPGDKWERRFVFLGQSGTVPMPSITIAPCHKQRPCSQLQASSAAPWEYVWGWGVAESQVELLMLDHVVELSDLWVKLTHNYMLLWTPSSTALNFFPSLFKLKCQRWHPNCCVFFKWWTVSKSMCKNPLVLNSILITHVYSFEESKTAIKGGCLLHMLDSSLFFLHYIEVWVVYITCSSNTRKLHKDSWHRWNQETGSGMMLEFLRTTVLWWASSICCQRKHWASLTR